MQEAKSSLNFFGVTKKGWRCQFTLRDESEAALLDRFGKFVTILETKGIVPYEHTKGPVHQSKAEQAASQLTVNGKGDHGEYEIVQGGVISVISNEKGDVAYKYKGGRFKQFGVRVWPEVLEQLGWKLDSMRIGKEYSVENYRAKILLKKGRVSKVIELIPAA
ncbi:hypothetical protein HY009_07410 [Candidatus Acetothermia bacterium]|nr:hypothetical protein [Candidatus Acetothermia bacterium]